MPGPRILLAGGRSGADGCGLVGAIFLLCWNFVEPRIRDVGAVELLHELLGLGMVGELVVGDLIAC